MDGELVLSRQAERGAARDQHRERRAGAEQGRYRRRSRPDPLEVVQHQQDRAGPEDAGQALRRGVIPEFGEGEGCGDGGEDEARVVERGQPDEADTAPDLGVEEGRDADGQAGLADPAGTRQREQAQAVAAQQVRGSRDLALPADERRQGRRQGRCRRAPVRERAEGYRLRSD
jgi:hypothetical protein